MQRYPHHPIIQSPNRALNPVTCKYRSHWRVIHAIGYHHFMSTADLQVQLDTLLTEVRACTLCEELLPLDPRPILRAHSDARILIIGQAPGTRVHQSGVPWDDPSGIRLREWLDVTPDEFYDVRRFAIIPMGFCYPGKDKRSGDNPPRPECAPHWHKKLLDLLPNVKLTLLIGNYAQHYYLREQAAKTLTETVRQWKTLAPDYIPAPHPSPRNIRWRKSNPWFEEEVVPVLRARTRKLLGPSGTQPEVGRDT